MNLKKIVSTSVFLCVASFAAPQVGDKAVAFNFPELINAKKNIQMKDYDKEVVLLNVWASWCKGCKKEMPLFHELGKKFKGKNFTVVAVNIDKKPGNANEFLTSLNDKVGERAKITFAYDKKKMLPKAYEAKAVPFSLLVKNGKVVKTYLGSFNESNEKELIADIKAAL